MDRLLLQLHHRLAQMESHIGDFSYSGLELPTLVYISSLFFLAFYYLSFFLRPLLLFFARFPTCLNLYFSRYSRFNRTKLYYILDISIASCEVNYSSIRVHGSRGIFLRYNKLCYRAGTVVKSTNMILAQGSGFLGPPWAYGHWHGKHLKWCGDKPMRALRRVVT